MTETVTEDPLLDFVNTRADAGGRQELFGDGAALSAWLDGRALSDGAAATDADAASARELRDALVTMLLGHSGEDLPAEEVELAKRRLERAGKLYPLTARVDPQGVSLVSEQRGVARLLGTVLASVTMRASRGEWDRIKACRNPPCHFGFIDRTRNGSGQYCSPACSSQVSMRKYRARRREEAEAEAES
jgi:predicted RNA-binding Zn ribbon-like protein